MRDRHNPNIIIKTEYEPGEIVTLLPTGRYGLVLQNTPNAVHVMILSTVGIELLPTKITADWNHVGIASVIGKNNTLANKLFEGTQ